MVTARRIVFYLFFTAYLVVCPLTLLYSFGMIWTPKEAQSITRTGLISVSTVPSGARVYLNSKRYAEPTPALVQDLAPGDYTVRVVARGYQPWLQTLRVKPGRAAVIEDLWLLPNRLQVREYENARLEGLLPLSDKTFLAWTGDLLGEWRIWHESAESSRPLLPPASPWQKAKVRTHWARPGSPWVLMEVRKDSERHVLWIDASRQQSSIVDLTRFVTEPPKTALWMGRDPKVIWVLSERGLDAVNPESRVMMPQLFKRPQGLGIFDNRLLAVDASGRTLAVDASGDVDPHNSFAPVALEHLPRALPAKITAVSTGIGEQTLLLLDARGALWQDRRLKPLSEERIVDLLPHPNRPVVLLQGKSALGLLDYRSVPPADADRPEPTVNWILEHGDPILQILWIEDGRRLLFRDKQACYLVQLWNTPKPSVSRLLSVHGRTDLAWMEERRELFFLDPQSRRLQSVRLVESENR